MNELDCSVGHAHTGGSCQSGKRQLQVHCHLNWNYGDTGSRVQEGKVRVFGEVGNMMFGPKQRVVRCELFVSDNMLDRFVKIALSAFVPTFTLQMSRKIATTSTKVSTPTPFAFGPRLESREWIDSLRR